MLASRTGGIILATTTGANSAAIDMGQNEAAVISLLKEFLQDAASLAGGSFSSYPLGPQDRNVLADDILASSDYFAIVESKWSERQLKSEADNKTERVKRLCEGLAKNTRMAEFHAKCHKIAWRDSKTQLTMLRSYREQICRASHPNTCSGLPIAGSLDADSFAQKFFGAPPDHCLSPAEFLEYVTWLLQTVTGENNKTVTILARQKNRNGKSISKEVTLKQLSQGLTLAALKKAASKTQTKNQRP